MVELGCGGMAHRDKGTAKQYADRGSKRHNKREE